MREASIHISESRLITILEKVMPKGVDIKGLAKDILVKGRKYSLSKRQILVTNQRTAKKTEKLILSDLEDAQLFSQLLISVRKQLKHRGIGIIKVGSKEWLQIKEVTKLAIDFCNDFKLEKRSGFVNYIKIGLEKMNRYSLVKFNGMQQTICEHYAAMEEMEDDPSPRLTEQMHNVYNDLLNEKTGQGYDYKKNPEKYIYFIKAKEEALKFNVSVEVYIKAQFAGLSFANGIPDPLQLVGIKAEERLKKYMYTNNITSKKEIKSNIDWDKVRKAK